MHPLRLQAVPAYGNHTRPDNWYKNLMGTYIVLNELRHLGIESPDAQWHTANPDDVLLNRPAVKYVEAPEQDASCLPVRKGNIKEFYSAVMTEGRNLFVPAVIIWFAWMEPLSSRFRITTWLPITERRRRRSGAKDICAWKWSFLRKTNRLWKRLRPVFSKPRSGGALPMRRSFAPGCVGSTI